MRKLPVFAAIGHSISIVTNNWMAGLKISWAWLALIAVATLVSTFTAVFSSAKIGAGTQPVNGQIAFTIFIGILLFATLFLFAFSSIAVNWHRYILRNEMPIGTELLRSDGLVRRYLKNSIFIVLLMFIPLIIIGWPLLSFIMRNSSNPATMARYLAIFQFIFSVFAGAFVNRMSLKLPAIALGRRDFTFSNAMNLTASNFWRLVGFSFVVVVMFTVIIQMFKFAQIYAFPHMGMIGSILSFGTQLAFLWFYVMFGIAAITTLYGFFVEGREF